MWEGEVKHNFLFIKSLKLNATHVGAAHTSRTGCAACKGVRTLLTPPDTRGKARVYKKSSLTSLGSGLLWRNESFTQKIKSVSLRLALIIFRIAQPRPGLTPVSIDGYTSKNRTCCMCHLVVVVVERVSAIC